MELNRCKRCGAFYATSNDVCPKCVSIDNLELSTFKNYIDEYGYDISIDIISNETGISQKNISRFLINENLNLNYSDCNNKKGIGNIGISFN